MSTNSKDPLPLHMRIPPVLFKQFKEHLAETVSLDPDNKQKLLASPFASLYSICLTLNIQEDQVAHYISEFIHADFLEEFNHDEVDLSILSLSFCRENSIAAAKDKDGEKAIVISNPFNWSLLDLIDQIGGETSSYKIVIATPKTIKDVLQSEYFAALAVRKEEQAPIPSAGKTNDCLTKRRV